VKSVQSNIDQALKTGITNEDKANQQWADIDKQITDDAPWVAMFNPKFLDFVGKRVTNYQFSPQWYFLLAQASVAS
jgi:peptide/nickel transport system substrate-binding protein